MIIGVLVFKIVKFVFDISKKTFPTASTFILAVAVPIPGSTTDSDPSFAVFEIKVTG